MVTELSGIPSASVPEPVRLDAVELSWSIRRRELTCEQVAEAFLTQMDRFNPLVNAIVSRADEQDVLAQARARDAELDRGEWAGWMHGFPIAVKDLTDAEGFPTTQGFEHTGAATEDAIFVRRMRAAGAIVVGKTNVPEFGLGSHTFNPLFGTTTNPYDPGRAAGGSSGGAAAALAMRLLPVADGSDFMGSLRNPAAFCNVLSLRPGFGRIPAPGFVGDPAVPGPMARTVRDLAMLLSTMAGSDERAPLSAPQDPAVFTGALDRDVSGLRIGWVGDFDGYLATEPGVLDLCRGAAERFASLGCVVEPVPRLPVERAWDTFLLWRRWMVGEKLHDVYRSPGSRARMKPEALYEVEGYLELTVQDIAAARAGRDAWRESVSELFDRYDFLLAPSAQVFPFDAGSRWPDEIDGRPMDTYHRWMEVAAPWTLSGHPVLNLPAGFGAAGVPTGVSLVGRGHGEWSLLQLGHAYEQATDWVHAVLPPALT
ncbi:amidase [Saccharopolyspora sp. MS10]|uniref:amidase n=1 Tax=Saccharopolyspora sp. MS10 TaxID=3385973 RepID=UPI0039A24239